MATVKYQTYDGRGNLVSEVSVPVDPETVNRDAVQAAARAALSDNKAFVASAPTAAQTAAQVKALSRQVNGLIRALLNQFDAAD